MLAETVVPFSRKNFVTGRFEWSQRDELFEDNHDLGEQVTRATGQHAFNVTAYTAGYTRDIGTFRNLQAGVGANVTAYGIDTAQAVLRRPSGGCERVPSVPAQARSLISKKESAALRVWGRCKHPAGTSRNSRNSNQCTISG